MKFGKLTDLTGVDLSLPPDHPQTKQVLNRLDPVKPNFYVGGTQWGKSEWIGKWYPKGTKQADFLHHYSRQFNTIELNATHYRVFPEKTVRNWFEQTPAHFRFCPKWPQIISHRMRFRQAELITTDFLRTLLQLEDKLGPSFIQLPPNFTPNWADVLIAYLQALPRDLPVTVEFRHPDWFTGSAAAERVFDVMELLGIGTCLSDTAGRRDVVNMRLTTDFFLLRFVGNGLHETDLERMKDWAQRLSDWTANGLREVYVFMHQPDALLTPEASVELVQLLNKYSKAELQAPVAEEVQGRLFG